MTMGCFQLIALLYGRVARSATDLLLLLDWECSSSAWVHEASCCCQGSLARESHLPPGVGGTAAALAAFVASAGSSACAACPRLFAGCTSAPGCAPTGSLCTTGWGGQLLWCRWITSTRWMAGQRASSTQLRPGQGRRGQRVSWHLCSCAAAACVESTTMHHAVPPTVTLRSQALLGLAADAFHPATPACLQVILCVLAVAPGLWPPTQWCLASLLPRCRALMATTSRPAGAKERGRRY